MRLVNQHDNSSLRRLSAPDGRLAQLGIAFVIAGIALCVLQLLVVGVLTVPAPGLSVIGALLLAAEAVAARIGSRPTGNGPAGDDDAGNGGGDDGGDLDPPSPGGGDAVDWDAFERDFRAYAEAVTADADLLAVV